MRRGKKTLVDRPVEWKVSLPSSLAGKIELLLSDPLTGKPGHGERSRLLTRLLSDWLSAREKELDNSTLPGYDSPMSSQNQES